MHIRMLGAMLGLILGLAAALSPGQAADWSVVPAVDARGEYDSNLNFALRNRESDFILRLSPSAKFNYTTELGQLQGALGFKGLHYISNSNLDHIDQNVGINGSYQAAPRLKLTLTSAYVSDSTLVEELEVSGRVIGRTVRQSLQVNPGFTYTLAERLLLDVGYGFYDVRYRSDLFTDYSTQRVSLGLNYLLKNEKTTLRGMVLGRFTDYPEVDNSYKSLGTYLGAEHKFSEDWQATLMGGVNVTRASLSSEVLDFSNFPFFVLVKQVQREETTVSPYVEFATTRRWTNTTLTGGFTLDISPSGGGTVSDYSRAYAGLSYSFSERLTGRFDGSLYYNAAIFDFSGGNGFIFTLSPQLTYRLLEKLSLNSGYQFGWREDRTSELTASRNLVWISLNYSYPMHYQR